MNNSSIFDTPKILRTKWKDFQIFPKSKQIKNTIDMMSEILIWITNEFNFAAISPQNIAVDMDWILSKELFYKNIIIIRGFLEKEFFEIINPSYEILSNDKILMHEWCWSIGTNDWLPFMVLNSIPTKIKVKWFTRDLEKVDEIIFWDTKEKQEMISYIIHEINHLEGRIISDWEIIRALVKWDKKLSYELSRKFPELITSFLEYTKAWYIIHNLWNKWISHPCFPKVTSKKWNDILPFHFDVDYDFDLLKSSIRKNWKDHKILLCKKCFDK